MFGAATLCLMVTVCVFWCMVNAIQPVQASSMTVSQSGSDLDFFGQTVANARVLIQVRPGSACYGGPGMIGSIANITTSSSSSGTFFTTFSLKTSQISAGQYAATLIAMSYNLPYANDEFCVFFVVTSPVPEFSQITMLAVVTMALSLVILRRTKK